MKKAVYNILPETEDILKTMGEQIKLARLRRDLPVELVAERESVDLLCGRSSQEVRRLRLGFMPLFCMH